ncbi:MAG: primosomal protein [Nakamurella sp.]
MAAEIIPIQLSLTQGDVVTLWAPTWVENDDEWEAFLGHGDNLYVFKDPAHLAAFIRSDAENDLTDHPAWPLARRALADELEPDDDHHFDIVGIPELVSAQPTVWSLAELADTVSILRSLAEVCDLPAVDAVLSSSVGFASAAQGQTAFIGRSGKKLWHEIGRVVADKWDTIIEALDATVVIPETDSAAVESAQAELDAVARSAANAPANAADGGADEAGDSEEVPRDLDLEFWDEVGIDCISVTVGERTGWGLRCYLADAPVFLSSTADTVLLFPTPVALEKYLSDPTVDNSLSNLDAWTTIREAINGGEASVIAGPENTYLLDGLDNQLLDGPLEVDANQLSLATELLADAATTRKDDEVSVALSTATALGNLLRAVTIPDAGRLPPSPPFDDEVAAWRVLVDTFASHIEWK